MPEKPQKKISLDEAIRMAKKMKNAVIVHSEHNSIDTKGVRKLSSSLVEKGNAYLIDEDKIMGKYLKLEPTISLTPQK